MELRDGLGYHVFDFCNQLAGLVTPAEIVDLFHKEIAKIRFDFSIVTGVPADNQRFEQMVLLQRLPAGWFETYTRGNFASADPVLRRCRTSTSMFNWTEAGYDPHAEPKARKVMQQAIDFGLASGFSLPIHRADGNRFCFSISGARIEMSERFRPALHLMMMYTCEHLLRLSDKPPDSANPLTQREREVLRWSGSGKSASETAELMKITERTVNAHAGAAITKLGANNRTQAVVRAMQFRFIDL
ncbi:LuxR family transcriptional regulator [Variibacter gotjawalensis]|nr:LuxR family transcriptional regulator [Variibacter gotjawalensis]NIK47284.1 LuxR family quorum sensing-dependent transcriptional regulator [Variibacter gotjawalensis]